MYCCARPGEAALPAAQPAGWKPLLEPAEPDRILPADAPAALVGADRLAKDECAGGQVVSPEPVGSRIARLWDLPGVDGLLGGWAKEVCGGLARGTVERDVERLSGRVGPAPRPAARVVALGLVVQQGICPAAGRLQHRRPGLPQEPRGAEGRQRVEHLKVPGVEWLAGPPGRRGRPP
eukprot:scaffold6798_cov108-Isochrysis_galbana.AAC.9